MLPSLKVVIRIKITHDQHLEEYLAHSDLFLPMLAIIIQALPEYTFFSKLVETTSKTGRQRQIFP